MAARCSRPGTRWRACCRAACRSARSSPTTSPCRTTCRASRQWGRGSPARSSWTGVVFKWLKRPAAIAVQRLRLLHAAEAVRVEAVGHAEMAEPLDLPPQRIEPVRDLRQSEGMLIGAHQRAHRARLHLQHQLLRPGQFRLDELDVVIGEPGAPCSCLYGIIEGA